MLLCVLFLIQLGACGAKSSTTSPEATASGTASSPIQAEEQPLIQMLSDLPLAQITESQQLEGTVYVTTMEHERLYAIDEYGHSEILHDDYCTDFAHVGDTVIAGFDNGDIYRFDLSKHTKKLLASLENSTYNILPFDGGFVFCVSSIVETEYFIYDNKTETYFGFAANENLYNLCLIGRKLYASLFDIETNQPAIAVYSVDTGERVALITGLGDIGEIYTQDGKLYYNLPAAENACTWYELNLTQYTTDIPEHYEKYPVEASNSILYRGKDHILVYDNNYLSESFTIGFVGQQGVVETQISLNSDAWLMGTDLVDGKLLLKIGCMLVDDELSDVGKYYTKCTWYVFDTDNEEMSELTVNGRYGSLFKDGDFPIIDTSTARKPLSSSIYLALCEEHGSEGAKPLCSKTHGAWLNIADRKADVGLLSYPTNEEQEYLAEQGVSVQMKLYGGDGLVFIGNKACGVTDISVDQIYAIYRGEITNWKELGGVDAPIRVLYRNDQSGSQRIFESMLWKDTEKPNFHQLGFAEMDTMSSIVGECLYNPYTIGYSIMTYLSNIDRNEELLCFSVNGMEANQKNIENNNYPFSTQGYVVIRSDEAEDSPARRLFNWFGSPLADDLLRTEGIYPLHS